MSSLKVIIPLIIIFVLAIAGVYAIYKSQATNTDLALATPAASTQIISFPKTSPTPKLTPSPSPLVAMGSQTPNTGTDEIEVNNKGIQITSPTAGQQVGSTILVRGTANVTSQKVIITIVDTAGNTLGQGQAKACVGLDACNFEASIALSKAKTDIGLMEAYSPSTIDNSHTYQTTIPVSF